MRHEDIVRYVKDILETTNIPSVDTVEIFRVAKSTPITDIDVFAVFNNVMMLFECTDESGSLTDKKNSWCKKIDLVGHDVLLSSVRKRDADFYNKCLSKIKSRDRIFKRIFVKPAEEDFASTNYYEEHNDLYLMDLQLLRYFENIAEMTFNYCGYELLRFLNVRPSEFVTEEKDKTEEEITRKPAIMVDETEEWEVYVFEMRPCDLLKRSYVLRNEGWKSDSFQRILSKNKLKRMRNYLLKEKKGYPNNIIVTAEGIKFKDNKISFGDTYNTFCIIDGQHRLFSFAQNKYHKFRIGKGTNVDKLRIEDEGINELSKDSKLIVTAIKFKGLMSEQELRKKQAQLFSDINTEQTRIAPDLGLNLKELISPSSDESMANIVVKNLSKVDPFENLIATKWYHKGRIRRASLIKYGGLSSLVDISSAYFSEVAVDKLLEAVRNGHVSDYCGFCTEILRIYFQGIKEIFGRNRSGQNMWILDKKVSRLLTVTSLAGFCRLFRHFFKERPFKDLFKIDNKKERHEKIRRYIKSILMTLKPIQFEPDMWEETSSQWGSFENYMFDKIRAHKDSRNVKVYKQWGDKSLIRRR